MKRKIARFLAVVLLGLAICLPAAAAGAGTEGDPLVTLSYLNETFLAAVQKRIDEAVAGRNASLAAYIDGKLGNGSGSAGTVSSFAVVTIPAGKVPLPGGAFLYHSLVRQPEAHRDGEVDLLHQPLVHPAHPFPQALFVQGAHLLQKDG